MNKHPDDLQRLLATGCNHIRWQIHAPGKQTWPEYRVEVLRQVIELRNRIDEIIPRANVVVALMTPPGETAFMMGGKIWRQRLPDIWADIADAMKHVPGIMGFDLLNEPALATAKWKVLAESCIRRVKAIDKKRRCIVSSRKGEPGQLEALGDVAGADLYTVHFYSPMSYTHQGVLPGYAAPKKLPVNEPRRSLLDLAMAADKMNKPLYVGEFSCAVGAPEEKNWLGDVTAFLMRQKWHGAYHAYREAPVWAHDSSPSRERVLLRYFGGGV